MELMSRNWRDKAGHQKKEGIIPFHFITAGLYIFPTKDGSTAYRLWVNSKKLYGRKDLLQGVDNL